MTVVPGFTDCHNHAGGDVLLYEVLVGNPFEVEFVTIDSIIDEAARQGAADAARHLGRGLLLRRHQGEGQACQLNVHDLDEVSLDHPVVVRHRGGHTSFYNSKAFEMAGVTKATQEHGRRHLRSRREGRTERPGHRHGPRACSTTSANDTHSRPAEIDQRGARTASRTSRSSSSATASPRVHHEGGRPVGHPGGARARRTAAPRQLRSQRPGARLDDRQRHPDRLRRRVDQVRRNVRAHR